jgi:DnaD/phage-associated family protein
MIFAFDEQFAMFDITPIENQFILEYLPGAKGEYVKVYLYGLLCCYHPQKQMNLSSMGRELGMTEDEILAAFRYWERRGIVRRTSDHPPEWQYINIKQKNLVSEDPVDPEYVEFSRAIENSFDGVRDFHGQEIAACYEWKEEMNLPAEVIIMLLKHMSRNHGKHFKIKDAEKLAIRLSDEKAFSTEDAAMVLDRDEAIVMGLKKVLRKLGKKYSPSDANIQLYRKWTEEWHFTQEAIEQACDQTGKNDPSLALVDAILENTFKTGKTDNRPLDSQDVEIASRRHDELRQILNETGQNGPATPIQKKLYSQMRALYPQEIILLAAQECAMKQKQFDSVLKLLQSWQERGFTDEKQIRTHIQVFHEKEEFIRKLKSRWSGNEIDVGQKILQLLDKWEIRLEFSREMILLAADLSFEAKKPIAYMDRILTYWNDKKIKTPEDVRNDQQEHLDIYRDTVQKPGMKKLNAQEYQQRDYSGEQDEARRRMIALIGGQEDA